MSIRLAVDSFTSFHDVSRLHLCQGIKLRLGSSLISWAQWRAHASRRAPRTSSRYQGDAVFSQLGGLRSLVGREERGEEKARAQSGEPKRRRARRRGWG